MKGIISILEVSLTAFILILAFLFFFPQYSIKTRWDDALLKVTVRDSIYAIDSMNKTYDFATNTTAFNEFMNATFNPQYTGTALVWWKDIQNLTEGQDSQVPYFSRAQKTMIIDIVNKTPTAGYDVYSFTLGMGFVF